MLHEQILRFYSGFRRDSHPMAIMVGIVGALSSFYPEKNMISQQTKENGLRLYEHRKTSNNGSNGVQHY